MRFKENSIAEMKMFALGLVEYQHLLKSRGAFGLDGAGLYVLMRECDRACKPVTQAWLELLNVVASPHAAASSRNGLATKNMVAACSVVAVRDGGMPDQATIVADGRRGRSANA